MNTKKNNNSDRNTPRLLGVAFLFQAITSLVWTILLSSLIVIGDISASMINIANNALQMRASIAFAMFTSIGVATLGVLLFETLWKQNIKIALVALGLYLIEAALLAASRIPAFALLHISQEFVIAGHPANLQTLGNLFYQAADFGDVLHMVAFGLGATLFYYLFFKSGYLPRALAIFGLIAAPLAFIGILFLLFGYDVPLLVFLPNLPFELGIGLWLIIKGFNSSAIDSGSDK